MVHHVDHSISCYLYGVLGISFLDVPETCFTCCETIGASPTERPNSNDVDRTHTGNQATDNIEQTSERNRSFGRSGRTMISLSSKHRPKIRYAIETKERTHTLVHKR